MADTNGGLLGPWPTQTGARWAHDRLKQGVPTLVGGASLPGPGAARLFGAGMFMAHLLGSALFTTHDLGSVCKVAVKTEGLR